MMDNLFAGYRFKGVAAYLDDIVIYSNTFEGMMELLKMVLKTLHDRGLYINMGKCRCGYSTIRYSGFIVDQFGISPDPEKLAAVRNLKVPTDVSGVRRFLGTVGYFRQFIQDFAIRSERSNRKSRSETYRKHCLKRQWFFNFLIRHGNSF